MGRFPCDQRDRRESRIDGTMVNQWCARATLYTYWSMSCYWDVLGVYVYTGSAAAFIIKIFLILQRTRDLKSMPKEFSLNRLSKKNDILDTLFRIFYQDIKEKHNIKIKHKENHEHHLFCIRRLMSHYKKINRCREKLKYTKTNCRKLKHASFICHSFLCVFLFLFNL